MNRINIFDFQKNNEKHITSILTLKQFIDINLLAFGIYKSQKISNRQYLIYDSFTGELVYKITA